MKFALVALLSVIGTFAAPVNHAKRYVSSSHVSAAADKRGIGVIQVARIQHDERYVPTVHVSSAPQVE